MNNTKISDSNLLSSYLYIDVDNTQKYLIIKLVSAITNHKRKFNNKDINIPIFIYKNSQHIIFLNDLENLEYFITFFLSFSFLVIEIIYI